MRKMRNAYKILIQEFKGKRSLTDLGIDVDIVMKWITGKYGVKLWD
jgi:hypothetical protein